MKRKYSPSTPVLSKDAIRRLRQVQRQIQKYPHLYNQRDFVNVVDPCGGACCIAGWIVWNEDPKRFLKAAKGALRMEDEAREILGIDSGFGLFGVGASWPSAISEKLFCALNLTERAEAGAEAIEAFIKADGSYKWNRD